MDADYEAAMSKKCSDFSEARSYLIGNEKAHEYYQHLERKFPTCHFVFATIVTSRYYTVPVLPPLSPEDMNIDASLPELPDEDLNRKNRMILMIFLDYFALRIAFY